MPERNRREVEKLPDDVRDLESLRARQLSESAGLETPGRVREAHGVTEMSPGVLSCHTLPVPASGSWMRSS